MADDVNIPDASDVPTPIATDEVVGRHHQLVKMEFGEDGTATPVSPANPMPTTLFGEVVEQLSAIRMLLQSMMKASMGALPDVAGRQRVNVETGSVGVSSLPTLANVTTVATVSSQTNQVNIGGLPATEQIPSLMRMGSDALRRNITVTP